MIVQKEFSSLSSRPFFSRPTEAKEVLQASLSNKGSSPSFRVFSSMAVRVIEGIRYCIARLSITTPGSPAQRKTVQGWSLEDAASILRKTSRSQ